jgi:hypothetical protein
VRDTVVVEDRQKPVVMAVTEEFLGLGVSIADVEGHSNMQRLIFPYPLEGLPEEEVRKIAREYFPKFLDVIGVKR